jgi:hypothetical protein
VDWTAIEDALAAWALAGSGLPVGSVIWAYQGGPRPQPPYLALSLTDVRQIGHDWADREDEPGGIKLLHRGPRMATLDLQLFGGVHPVAQLADTLSALGPFADELDHAGIGIGDTAPVQLVAGRVNTLLEPRAVASVELHLFSELESYAEYIARVEGAVEVDGDPVVDFVVEFEPPEES